MTKIGVISDSHHRSDIATQAIKILKKQGVHILIHSGDIVELKTLEDMKNSLIPYVAILGNNDANLQKYKNEFNLFYEPYRFQFNHIKFNLMHYPFYFSNAYDINIYGHTHYFQACKNDKSLFVNSGEICARKKPLHEFAMIEFDSEIKVIKFEKALKSLSWVKKEFCID